MDVPRRRWSAGSGGGGCEPQQDDPMRRPAHGVRPHPPRVSKTVGLNRFVWDVRHKEGPVLPPGRYQARLKVGDKTLTEGSTC